MKSEVLAPLRVVWVWSFFIGGIPHRRVVVANVSLNNNTKRFLK